MLEMSVIERAGRVLVDAAQSPARVILFGSGARGDSGASSDLDFLVIERTVDDRATLVVFSGDLDKAIAAMVIATGAAAAGPPARGPPAPRSARP